MQSSAVGKASEEEKIGRTCFSKAIPLEYAEEESLYSSSQGNPLLVFCIAPPRQSWLELTSQMAFT